MKILIYTSHRTGSTALANFLSLHYNCDYTRRLYYNSADLFEMDIKNKINGIFKVCPEEDTYENVKNLFDKKIVLVRGNTTEQAESRLYGDITRKHFRPYTIPDNFFDEYKDRMDKMIDTITKENSIFNSLVDCLYLTYEELYYSPVGIEKLENYLDTKFKFKLDSSKRYRNAKKTFI
jgi:hypothetical protein